MAETFQQRELEKLNLREEEIRGDLRSDGKLLAGAYKGTTSQMQWDALRRIGLVIGRADMGLLQKARAVGTVGSTLWKEGGNDPFDTDFLHDADPALQSVARDLVRGMMLPGSGFADERSSRNFQKGMALNRTGASVMFELMPHTSELDPVFVETILENTVREARGDIARDAQEFLEKDFMVVGHKVFLSRVRRTFARAIRTLFTVAPKYRIGNPNEKKLVADLSRAVGSIMEAMRSSTEHVLMLCPEGGRTVNGQIGLHRASSKIEAYRVPLHLEMPVNFLGLDATAPDALQPARVRLYCGEPFLQKSGVPYVESQHQSLAQAGAPVDEYAWGYLDVQRNAPGIDFAKGAPQIFHSVIDERKRKVA